MFYVVVHDGRKIAFCYHQDDADVLLFAHPGAFVRQVDGWIGEIHYGGKGNPSPGALADGIETETTDDAKEATDGSNPE